VLLLTLATVLPPPEDAIDSSIWGAYSKHQFGTSKLHDIRQNTDRRSQVYTLKTLQL
jgi:hypothetical protein